MEIILNTILSTHAEEKLKYKINQQKIPKLRLVLTCNAVVGRDQLMDPLDQL